MRVAVLGAGNGGVASAFDFAQHGHEVALYAAPEFGANVAAVAAAAGITAGGDLELVCPGSCAGAIAFKRAAGLELGDESILVGETSTLPYAVRVTDPGVVNVFLKLTTGVYLAGLPRAATQGLLELVKDVWPAVENAGTLQHRARIPRDRGAEPARPPLPHGGRRLLAGLPDRPRGAPRRADARDRRGRDDRIRRPRARLPVRGQAHAENARPGRHVARAARRPLTRSRRRPPLRDSLGAARRRLVVMGSIRSCRDDERPAILAIINAAAEAYRGVIPADRWHEPYMASHELEREVAAGVRFWGYEDDGALVGVMGIQPMGDVDLIRHAYVTPASQGRGIGGELLERVAPANARQVLVGTWAAAEWAIRFYRRHGFEQVSPERKTALLETYWTIPDRQIESSVVLARPPLVSWEGARAAPA